MATLPDSSWTTDTVIKVGTDGIIKSQDTPALLGFAGNLFLVWTEQSQTKEKKSLLYSVMPSSQLPLGRKIPFDINNGSVKRAKVIDEPVIVSPCLASFNGVVHLVYSNADSDIIHLQLVETLDTVNNKFEYSWKKRAGLAAKSLQPSCLCVFRGALWCVYKPTQKEQLASMRWDATEGWSVPTPTGIAVQDSIQRALVNADGELRLFITKTATKTTQEAVVLCFVYNPSNQTWVVLDETQLEGPKTPNSSDPLSRTLPSDIQSTLGVSAIAYTGGILLAFSPASGVATIEYMDPYWYGQDIRPGVSAGRTPAVTFLDNYFICVWPAYKSWTLRFTTRSMISAPILDSWMGSLPNGLLISDITIPGTHDSCALANWRPFTRTQFMTINEMLTAGIRFFDLRAGYASGVKSGTDFILYHGWFSMADPASATGNDALHLGTVFQNCYDFLDTHKSEGLIISIKNESGSHETEFSKGIMTLVKDSAKKKYWSRDSGITTVGELRGKIQLLRRFPIASAPAVSGSITTGVKTGIDVSGKKWPDNDTFTIPVPTQTMKPARPACTLEVQDEWKLIPWTGDYAVACQKKFEAVKTHLIKANNSMNPQQLFINFTSASGIPVVQPIGVGTGFVTVKVVTYWEGVNVALARYVREMLDQKAKYGIVVMDFPETPRNLVALLVATNFR